MSGSGSSRRGYKDAGVHYNINEYGHTQEELRILDIEIREREYMRNKRQNRIIEIRDGILYFVGSMQVITYLTAVAVTWFYFENKTLAIAIAAAVTVVHALNGTRSWFKRKMDQLSEDFGDEKDAL